jgi:hypothetical protein
LEKSTSYEALHYVVFSILLSLYLRTLQRKNDKAQKMKKDEKEIRNENFRKIKMRKWGKKL